MRVEAQGGAEFGHRLADRAIEVAAHFVGVAEIFLGVVQQAVAQVVVFVVRAVGSPGVVQTADDGFVDGGFVGGFARRAALGAVGDQLFAARLHALSELGLQGQGTAEGLGDLGESGSRVFAPPSCRANQLKLWLLVGSAHRLTPPAKPHNSLYFIGPDGRVHERYDKRFLSGDGDGKTGDLAHYSPGDHFSVVEINGISCGALICVDCRYAELYRGYKSLGAELIFHSFNAAHVSAEHWPTSKPRSDRKITR